MLSMIEGFWKYVFENRFSDDEARSVYSQKYLRPVNYVENGFVALARIFYLELVQHLS